MSTAILEPVIRPNGKLYRPRRLTAHAVTDYDELTGVIVFGTHDPGRAQSLADEYAAWQCGSGHCAVDPIAVWWRDGFECGRRGWITDKTRGRAGVWFREIVERSAPPGGAA